MVEAVGGKGSGRVEGGAGDEGAEPARAQPGDARRNDAMQSLAGRFPPVGTRAADLTWGTGRGAPQPAPAHDPVQFAIAAAQSAETVGELKRALDAVRRSPSAQSSPAAVASDERTWLALQAVARRALQLSEAPESGDASVAPVLVDAAGLVSRLQHGADEAYVAVRAVANMRRRQIGEPAYAAVLTALAGSVRNLSDHHQEAAVLELISDVRDVEVKYRRAPWLALARASSGDGQLWPWTREQLLSEAALLPTGDYRQIAAAVRRAQQAQPAP